VNTHWGRLGRFWVMSALACAPGAQSALAGVPAECDAITVRAIHPDRQAEHLLKLFEGSRAPHPAAALAGWKRATREPQRLGKTLEALIALANPEMVREWQIFHQAELRMNFNPASGAPSWHIVVPHDDGSARAVITAFRLSDLEDAPPLIERGREHVVTRFIRTASVLLTHSAATLVLAGSRDDLGEAIRRLDPGTDSLELPGRRPGPDGPGDRSDQFAQFANKGRSGVIFDLRPSRITTPTAGSMEWRRAIELLHASSCARMAGSLALDGDRLSLDVKTLSDTARSPVRDEAASNASVEPDWLALLPAHNLIGIVSLAIDASPPFWNRLFAVADRVERVDPAYRNVAALRTRFNLVAKGGGLRPEADLWPHLRGITAAVVGDPEQAGRLSGGILVLHVDTAASAAYLANQFIPRLSALGKGRLTLNPAPDAAGLAQRGPQAGVAEMPSSKPRTLGTISGRTLAVRRIERDVLLGWGDETTIALLSRAGNAANPAGILCAGWAGQKPAPARFGAFWPGRLAAASSLPVAATPVAGVLADDPPVFWWGWNEAGQAHDVVVWYDLSRRLKRFLDELPMDDPPYR
jgi:hypothetical protein